MVKIGIIIGSVRPTRRTPLVAEFIYQRALELEIDNAEFELVDLKDFDLPPYREVDSPINLEEYRSPEIERWSEKIKELDGFIFVTPEYNKAIPGALKDAIDHLALEWSNKAAGLVSFGSNLGVASTLSLRQILSSFKIATVKSFGAFNLETEFDDDGFNPSSIHDDTINDMITNTVEWSRALKTLR